MVRHVAWDAAYLRVPWPSCWCCWRLPDALADRALQVWKDTFRHSYVESAAFEKDLQSAHLGWVMMSMSLSWNHAVDGAPQTPDEQAVMPTRRAILAHRLAGAPFVETVPHLSALAVELAEVTGSAWGEEPLPFAPAFR